MACFNIVMYYFGNRPSQKLRTNGNLAKSATRSLPNGWAVWRFSPKPVLRSRATICLAPSLSSDFAKRPVYFTYSTPS